MGESLPAPFNPKQSKYSIDREEKNQEIRAKRRKDVHAPEYLHNEQGLREELAQDHDLINPEEVKFQNQLAKAKEIEKNIPKEEKEKRAQQNQNALAEIAAKTQIQKRLETFDRFDKDFVDTYMLERFQKKVAP